MPELSAYIIRLYRQGGIYWAFSIRKNGYKYMDIYRIMDIPCIHGHVQATSVPEFVAWYLLYTIWCILSSPLYSNLRAKERLFNSSPFPSLLGFFPLGRHARVGIYASAPRHFKLENSPLFFLLSDAKNIPLLSNSRAKVCIFEKKFLA